LALANHVGISVIETPIGIYPPGDLYVTVLRGPDLGGIASAAQRTIPDLLVVIAEPGRAVTPEDAAALLAARSLAVVPIDPNVALAIDSGLFARRFDQLRAFDELRKWLLDWFNFT
jgi:hypothetical protein